jgi:RimJ/RimL family protein N-acetyltransferase
MTVQRAPLETPRLELEPVSTAHAEALHQAVIDSRPELLPWMPWAREPTLEASHEAAARSEGAWLDDREFHFVVVERGTGAVLGVAGLNREGESAAELHYWIRSDHTGLGLATEAGRALIDWAPAALGAQRLTLWAGRENQASRRVAEKLGFVHVGPLDWRPEGGLGTFAAESYELDLRQTPSPAADNKLVRTGMPTSKPGQATKRFQIRELGTESWPDFERIMEKHNGVWGGCWCVAFHPKADEPSRTVASNRAYKERLVRSNRAHAALVYEGPDVVGWAQFGPPAELPARMGGFRKLSAASPDWRITCFFVDRDRRREGVAEAALAGALRLIAKKGGGVVDGYPIATRGKPYSSSFLFGGTESMFSEAGFGLIGSLGTSKVVMRRRVRRRYEEK